MTNPAPTYQFDDFEVDLENRQLLRAGQPVALNAKYFDVLGLLIRRRGLLTTKEYLFDQVWNDVVVTDSALSQCIKDIRRQLGDNAVQPRYIKTIPKHGFIFISPVVEKTSGVKAVNSEAISNGIEKRPYKFLDYFTEQDEGLFFGREKEIELICSKVQSHRSFIVHGRSGVGKSSLARAGLTPALRRQGAQVFIIRSFKDPLEEMVQALTDHQTEEPTLRPKSDLSRQCLQLLERNRYQTVVFIFDQFEDFFLLLSEQKKQNFIHALTIISGHEQLPLRLLFVLREDLLAEMSRFKQAFPEIFHHEYRLGRLNSEQATRAIIEPARAVSCRLDPGLPAIILDDLSENDHIDPPQLQIVCDALFDGRDKSEGITLEEYRRMGGAPKILTGYLSRVLTRFSQDELYTAREILKTLISTDKTRLVLPVCEVQRRVESLTRQSTEFIYRLIEDLGRARIVRFRRQDGEAWLEVCHDFLIPEISQWLTAEEAAIKQARALLDRSVESYLSHQILIDNDSLEVILKESPYLGLNEEECNLMVLSILKSYGPVPDWLVKKAPAAQGYILEKLDDVDAEIRIRAIESCTPLKNQTIRETLYHHALRDKDLMVRKAASIKLIEQYGAEGQDLLARNGDKKAGIIRRSISLAFVRDHEKRMVYLTHLPFAIAILVTLGLMWVRILRARIDIFRQTGGGALGGSFSGMTIGLLLGIALAMARHAPTFETTTTILVLMSLGALAGAFGGFGVSLGIIMMQNISFRHSHYWSVIGGALGGFTIGGLLYILEVDIFRTLFGHQLSGVTGAYEGLVIGATLGLGRITGEQFYPEMKLFKILGAAFGSMVGAVLLTSIEGNLFSGSIEIIARSFSKSQLNLQPVAALFGEVYFGKLSRIILGAMEGFLFGGFMTAGMEMFRKR